MDLDQDNDAAKWRRLRMWTIGFVCGLAAMWLGMSVDFGKLGSVGDKVHRAYDAVTADETTTTTTPAVGP